MNFKSCFFIGHRDAPEEILPALLEAIEGHITNYGVGEFIVGGYGQFDRLAAKALVCAKSRHPEIILMLLTPYHPAERSMEVPPGFDGTFYPPGMESVPRQYTIARANRYMIDHADCLIAYAWHPASNAKNLVEYALKKGVPVMNLAAPLQE